MTRDDPLLPFPGYTGPPNTHRAESSDPGAVGERCGMTIYGLDCILPRGHNVGRADIPENHRATGGAVGERCVCGHLNETCTREPGWWSGGAVGEREEPLDVERLAEAMVSCSDIKTTRHASDHVAAEYARLSVNEGGPGVGEREELDGPVFGRIFGEVMRQNPQADIRLVNAVLRIVAAEYARLSVNEGSAPFTFTATNAHDTPEQVRESGWVAPVARTEAEPHEP